MVRSFLDTNIVLRHVLGDHPTQSPRATDFFRHIEDGEVQVRIVDTVIFEVVFTLERHYHRSKNEIRIAVLPLLDLPGIILPGKRRFRKVFDLYIDLNRSFADAYHAVVAEQLRLDQIVTYDEGFDRVTTIARVEP